MYKLLCLDLDGTLLNENHKVSEENKKAIIKALDAGIHVMLVSGRPNCFTSYLKTKIDQRMGQITFNGACFEVDEVSHYTYLNNESVRKIIKAVKKYDLPTYFKNRNEFFCTKEDTGLFNYEEYNKVIPKEDCLHIQYNINAESYINENNLSLLKIFVRDDEHAEQVMQMADELSEIDDIQIYRYKVAFEIAPKNASKGNAIKKICEILNIKKKKW